MQIYALFVKTPMKSDIFYQKQATFLVFVYLYFEFLHIDIFQNFTPFINNFCIFPQFLLYD